MHFYKARLPSPQLRIKKNMLPLHLKHFPCHPMLPSHQAVCPYLLIALLLLGYLSTLVLQLLLLLPSMKVNSYWTKYLESNRSPQGRLFYGPIKRPLLEDTNWMSFLEAG